MGRSGSSHYIDCCGPDDKALGEGLRWLVHAAREAGGVGMIAVTTKQILENVHWSQFSAVFDQLHKHGSYTIQGITLNLFTPGRATVYAFDGPILVMYGGQELLDAVDSIHGPASVLYIPFSQEDFKDWAATWEAMPLGSDAPEVVETQEPTTGVTLFALRSLTDKVNLNTGILNSSDYESAVRTLETLHHKGAALLPEIIRRQLIRLGWKPKDAKEVKELAEKISAGRRPKATKGKADEHLWSYWQSQTK